MQKSVSCLVGNCSAYDLPPLLACQRAKPPARLLVAEPAPSLTVSESEIGSRFKSKALLAAVPRAAKPEAEKPRPFPSLRLFSETTLRSEEHTSELPIPSPSSS